MTDSNSYKHKIREELSSFSNSKDFSFTSIFDKIYQYKYSDYTENYSEFNQFKIEQSDIYFKLAINEYKKSHHANLKKEIQHIALNDSYKRYDILIELDDKESFDIVLKNAEDFLKGDDYLNEFGYRYEDGQVLFDLIKAYYNPSRKEEVTLFFNQAFNFAKKYARENKEWDYLSGDPSGTILLVISQAISCLNAEDREEFSNLIFDIYTFCSSDEKSYELNQASGFIALLLLYYNKQIDIQVLENAINITGEHYKNNVFVHQTLYAKWLLTNDSESALSYLKSEEDGKGIIFAIMALADLNCKKALPDLESRLKEEKNPIFIEIYKEAIQRLSTQNMIPEIEHRMINLNGSLTPTQRALGTKSNNIFEKRAQEKIDLDNNVYETDDD
ncbi:hypothetical protein Q4566_00405 [Tamlana sp. 2_MG-2023]|uniref:hypothetical protein n=1 Tax=unclassified Tamlana TaxID=2614803 RepID=UPI0026E18CC9|nr:MULTISPECIES: hypothetical protein [unclassified Tamlana]MDO6758643.1 hypothetical protein [Tamlana sp. 2_MG-2023]MDO6789342.1 hypothetical protein [Tamlana sp. 1_MG-2023]